MRIPPYVLALVALTAWGAFRAELPARIDTWINGDEGPTFHAAIALRCDSGAAELRVECANDLQRDIDTGVQKPDTIVRLHCTRFTNTWALESESPSAICQELYGGWIEG